jgi:uncharacterized tellurite resistance protein B-like protein
MFNVQCSMFNVQCEIHWRHAIGSSLPGDYAHKQMKHSLSYATGLLALTSVLINSDGEISEKELEYIEKIRASEGIPGGLFASIRESILGKTEKEVYQIGIGSINACSDDEKLRAFVKMYQMAMVDGAIHVKEVRLLLYAVKITNVDINRVVKTAEQLAVVAVL